MHSRFLQYGGSQSLVGWKKRGPKVGTGPGVGAEAWGRGKNQEWGFIDSDFER